jgi:tRNA(Arg) A34 adenosine deaminase TadA/protein-tyrosine-phosphatase
VFIADDLTDTDIAYLRRAIALAVLAGNDCNSPFGAVLVGTDGRVLGEGQNRVVSHGRVAAHAEIEAIHAAAAHAEVRGSTIYASGEPCPMCSAALVWAGVRRIVFAAAETAFSATFSPGALRFTLDCRDIVASSTREQIVVVGPALGAEALAPFEHRTPCPSASPTTAMSQSRRLDGHARQPTHIMFVCMGNTCRSPMAAAILAARHSDAGVSSAGTSAGTGKQANPDAVKQMNYCDKRSAARGEMSDSRWDHIKNHSTTPYSSLMAVGQDFVICMGEDNAAIVRRDAGGADVRMWDVGDPHDLGEDAYRACAAHLDYLVGELALELGLQRT